MISQVNQARSSCIQYHKHSITKVLSKSLLSILLIKSLKSNVFINFTELIFHNLSIS